MYVFKLNSMRIHFISTSYDKEIRLESVSVSVSKNIIKFIYTTFSNCISLNTLSLNYFYYKYNIDYYNTIIITNL